MRNKMRHQVLTNRSYKKETCKHFEGAFTQGNGYINARASFEEDIKEEKQGERYWRLPANVTLEKIQNPVSKWGIYVPGIYGNHPILGEEIVNLPYLLGINLYCADEKFDMNDSRYTGFEQTLNIYTGILERKLAWETKKGVINVHWLRYLDRCNQNRIVQELRICAEEEQEIMLESFIDGDVTTNGYCHFTQIETDDTDGLEMYVTVDSGQEVGMKAACFIAGETPKPTYGINGNRVTETHRLKLESNRETHITRTSIIVTTLDDQNKSGVKKVLSMLWLQAQKDTAGKAEHELYWEKLWDDSQVLIEGDEKLEECLSFSIYHLLRSANRESFVAIDAKGYAGEAYFGHYFWDTEIYMLPFFIYTQPEQAKRLVRFRFHTLEQAKQNAARYGYQGARYPWEACVTGSEQCSNWQYADLEVHVTADVVYGLWQYCKVSGDKTFLLTEGLEILIETARYWIDRVTDRADGCHLLGVMGPDEYLPFTNDNAFTNYMVRFSLEKTLEVIEMADKERLEALKITSEECARIKYTAERMVLPIDADKAFILQCADFETYEEIDFETLWTDRTKLFGTVISQEKNYRSKALKQADTVALLCLFGDAFSNEMKRNCLNYYEPITTHDSSLSYIVHSLLYGQIGETKKSYEFAVKSMMIDWGSMGAGEGIHIANAGGLWQGVINGFGGLKGIDENGAPVIEPALPKHITQIKYSISIRGIRYRITVGQNVVEMEREDCSNERTR